MSQVIDTKVVEMQFDNSKFEKNIEVSLNSLKNLDKTIESAGKNRNSLDGLAQAGEQVGLSFDNMNMKSRISLNLMDMLAGVGTKAFNRISDAVAGFAMNMANSLSGMQAMRDGFNEYELKMGSVQTILAGAKIKDPLTGAFTKDDARRLEIVNEELQNLNEYSDKTIYSFKDMTSNIGKFTNAGVDLRSSVEAIQGVANVAAISGANANEASRAMYNFSQALSSGAVKLIDWKSIENANMATQGFKQQLLDTALAMGTVEKEGKNYISTTTNAQGKVSDLFNTTKGFNDSLAHQWMTTEVLTQTLRNYSTDVREMSDAELEAYKDKLKAMGYTGKQVKNIIETSRKAFEAATEVKTFTQMIDTLKESLGSGWAQTFEIVIGDFNEAKALFTSLNNTIDGILSPIGKARNAILQLWKDNGGRDAMLKGFSNLYHAVLNLLDPIKKLWKAFTPNTTHTGKALASISKGFEKVTEVVRKAADIVGRALAKILKPVISVGNKVGGLLLKLFGMIRDAGSKVFDKLSVAGKAIKTFGSTVGKAFNKQITERVKSFKESISKTFSELKKRAKESKTITAFVDAFNDLKTVIKDLFGKVTTNASVYASRFTAYLGRLWHALSPLLSSAVTSVFNGLSRIVLPRLRKALGFVTEKLKELGALVGRIDIKNSKLYKGLAELPDKIKAISENKTLKNAFSGIKTFGSEAIGYLSDKFAAFKKNLESIKMPNGLKDLFENIKGFIKSVFGEDSVSDELSKTLEDTADATEKVANEKSGEKLTTFQKFLQGVSDAFKWLKDAATNAKNAVKNFIDFIVQNTPKALKSVRDFIAGEDGILSLSDVSDFLYSVADQLSIVMTAFGFYDMGKAAKGISDAFGELAEATTTLLKRTSNRMQMASLKDFAIAVGVLAGAMFLLAQLPAGKLALSAGAIVLVAGALQKFFSVISSGDIKPWKVAGNLSIGALLVSIGVAMLGVAASVGILVLALKAFPGVIKQYNDLGKDFRAGMDRVKEVLEEIFAYLDHTINAKYGLRTSLALLGLVASLDLIRKTIVRFANKKTGESMADGLARIKEVLTLLGDFLSSVSIASFSFINVGIDLDTFGMAAIIFALAKMLEKIEPVIQSFAKLTPGEYKMAFKMLELIFFEFGAFLGGAGVLSFFTTLKGGKVGIGQGLGLGAMITLLSYAIGSIVSNIETIAALASNNPEGLKRALEAIGGIFLALGLTLMIAGDLKPNIQGLFGLGVAIGIMSFCVAALVPIAESHPDALIASVFAVGTLMVALGGALFLAGKAGGKTSMKDIIKLVVMTGAMVVLAQAIRRLARSGGDAGSIVAAGLAISVAALAMAGAMKILGSIPMINPMVLAGLALLALAIWGIVYAIQAFKGASGQAVDASNEVKTGVENMTEGANEALTDLSMNLDISGILNTIGSKIEEKLQNFDLGALIRNLVEQVKADVVNWAQDFIDIGTNLIDGLSNAISNPSNVAKVKNAMISLGKALVESFKLFLRIASPSKVMEAQGGFVIDGLVNGLMKFPEKLAEWASSIGEYIIGTIKGLFKGALEKGRELAGNLGSGIQKGKKKVSEKAHSLGQAALNKVGKAKEWAKAALKSANSFGEKLKSGKGPVKKAAGTMITGATGAVKGLAGIFKKSSSDAAHKFSSSLSAGRGPARSAAAALVTGAKSAFHGIGESFRTFGTWAAEGFKNGISSLISSVAEKAREMVRRAKEAAKSEENANSPSKDFMDYGRWAAEGYAIGLANRSSSHLVEANAKKMVNSAKKVASSSPLGFGTLSMDSDPAMKSLALAMSQISDSLDNSIESNLTIKPIIDMSDVNRNAASMSALFGDRSFMANVDVARSISTDFETGRSRNEMISNSISKLTNKIESMTDSMNSRSLNVYNTIDGTSDPEAFADGLIRSFRLKARTV